MSRDRELEFRSMSVYHDIARGGSGLAVGAACHHGARGWFMHYCLRQ